MTQPPIARVPLRPGQVLSLSEQDYRYGRGRIVLRVTCPHADTAAWFGGEWMWVDGVEVHSDGDGPRRRVLVRISALFGSR